MAYELVLDGKKYISSKRASQLTGYTRDYVGQLARGGQIDARRVSGLWYISIESLNSYKAKADEYKPQPPQVIHQKPDLDTMVTFDGRGFVSAARASEITGYHQDYIGQLARGGKIPSRQIGNRWFVDREALTLHKKEKDSLLAAVQAQAVGIITKPPDQEAIAFDSQPFFTYIRESASLLPSTPIVDETSRSDSTVLPIRRIAPENNSESLKQTPVAYVAPPRRALIRKDDHTPLYMGAVGMVTLVIVFIGITTNQLRIPLASSYASIGATTNETLMGSVAEFIEKFFARDITYQR